MWITIIAIGLALAMMIGPIMIMQPSQRQRRLARLRELALECGLKVRTLNMPQGSVRAGEAVSLYCLPLSNEKPQKETWLLLRQAFSHGAHFKDDWDWADDREAPPAWHAALQQALAELPASVVAVEAGGFSLGVAWLESTGDKRPEDAVAEIAQWLRQLAASLPVPAPAQQ